MNLAEWIFAGNRLGTFGFGQTAAGAAGGHAGLWFDRFGTIWATDRIVKKNGTKTRVYDLGPRTVEWIKSACQQSVGNPAELCAYGQRLRQLASAMGGDHRAFCLPEWGHFVTGVGIEHPVENGFAWHRTLGVPYLPGSGVKGMTLAWARDWNGMSGHDLTRIFGAAPDGKQPDHRLGSVIFLDAVPVAPPELSVEVLTPHGPGSGAPKDAEPTIPIGFLAVREATFLFAVLPSTTGKNLNLSAGGDRVVAAADAGKDCTTVLNLIGEALGRIGAGAKTKSGYGRFIAGPVMP